MEETKWWDDKEARKEVLKELDKDLIPITDAEKDIVLSALEYILLTIKVPSTKRMLKLEEKEGQLAVAVLDYLKVMQCNYLFKGNLLKETVDKCAELGVDLQLKNLKYYAQAVSDLAKSMEKLGCTDKVDVEGLLDVLRYESFVLISKDKKLSERLGLQVGHNLIDQANAILDGQKIEPPNAVWDEVDHELNNLSK